MSDFITTICNFGKAPEDRELFKKWLEMGDVLVFLKENAMTPEFVLYATGHHTFMHSVLVPNDRLAPPGTSCLGTATPLPRRASGHDFQPHPKFPLGPRLRIRKRFDTCQAGLPDPGPLDPLDPDWSID
jgi:hypothetical protein